MNLWRGEVDVDCNKAKSIHERKCSKSFELKLSHYLTNKKISTESEMEVINFLLSFGC